MNFLESLVQDASFWVAVALFLFFGLLIWKKVPGVIAGVLDKQIATIRAQIEQAKALRNEAQVLLARFEQDQKDAAQMAKDLVVSAEREAKNIADDSARALEDLIARRMVMAENKIAQAEAAAIKEVRKVAVEAATSAAARLIADNLGQKDQNNLVSAAIDGIDKRLH